MVWHGLVGVAWCSVPVIADGVEYCGSVLCSGVVTCVVVYSCDVV